MVSKATLFEDCFTAIYTILNNNVTDPISSSRSPSKWIFASFSDAPIDSKSDYPFLIIDPAQISWRKHTVKKNWAEITITIYVFSKKNRERDELTSDVIDVIESNKAYLRANDALYNIQLSGTDPETVDKTSWKIHMTRIQFTMEFPFTKTAGS